LPYFSCSGGPSVIVRVKFVRSFPYLLTTATFINLTNSSGVRLGVTIDVAVAIGNT
jgi:hypothetical protein